MNEPKVDPRYPIGHADKTLPVSKEALRSAFEDIATLPAKLSAAVDGLSDEQLDTPYRDGGWTVRQLVHHVADSHMHAFARMRFALTGSAPTIMPYDEAEWAKLPDSTGPVGWSLGILTGLHARWALMLESLAEEQWSRGYMHPESGFNGLELVVVTYGWHSRHHLAHITRLLEAKGW